ncbi:hypothetical protein ACHAXS_000673, partial [Conticribra weissflogii]
GEQIERNNGVGTVHEKTTESAIDRKNKVNRRIKPSKKVKEMSEEDKRETYVLPVRESRIEVLDKGG